MKQQLICTIALSLIFTSCFETKDNTKTKPVDLKIAEQVQLPQAQPKQPEATTTAQPATGTQSTTTSQSQQAALLKNQSKLSCIQSECGTTYPLEHEYVKHPELIMQNKDLIEKSLNRKIEVYMGQIIKNNLDISEVMSNLSKIDPNQIQFTTAQISFMNAFKYIKNIKKYYSALEYNSDNKIVFNLKKLKETNPDLTDIEVDAISTFSVIFNMGSYQNVDGLTLNNAIKLIKKTAVDSKVLTVASSDEEVFKFIVKLMNTYNDEYLYKIFTKDLIQNENQVILDKAFAMKKLTEKDQIQIIKMYSSLLIMYRLVQDEDIQSKFSKIPFSSSDIIKSVTDGFNKRLGKKENLKNSLKTALDQCKFELVKSYIDTPSKQETAKALNLMNMVVAKSNELIDRKIKSTSATHLDIQFFMPSTQDEIIENWSESFTLMTDYSKAMNTKIKNLNININENLNNLVATAYVLYGSNDGLFDSVLEICKQNEPTFLTDAAMPTENKFRTSSVTVKNIDFAIGVVAHEIGHIAKKNNPSVFTVESSCLEKNYDGKNQYENEDFADLFAAKVVNELNLDHKISKVNNMVCTFPQYKAMKLENINLINADKSGVHSSELYRLLAQSSDLGQLSSQCTSYLKTFEPQTKVFNNYCKWQE